ncbi:unnamed protein product [Ilex paraguariensis]|uniref:Uncharacterized protein n=1 Tax=Ilex paraguariensis TaxID=185542 RepID=A0ABC8TFW0_9AQUA
MIAKFCIPSTHQIVTLLAKPQGWSTQFANFSRISRFLGLGNFCVQTKEMHTNRGSFVLTQISELTEAVGKVEMLRKLFRSAYDLKCLRSEPYNRSLEEM